MGALNLERWFWQPGRGHDRNITNGRTLQKMIDYIHMNPVRQGLVQRASDWKWSSAGWFESLPLNDLKPDPIPWDWLEEDSGLLMLVRPGLREDAPDPATRSSSAQDACATNHPVKHKKVAAAQCDRLEISRVLGLRGSSLGLCGYCITRVFPKIGGGSKREFVAQKPLNPRGEAVGGGVRVILA